jgi:hypothetical protein
MIGSPCADSFSIVASADVVYELDPAVVEAVGAAGIREADFRGLRKGGAWGLGEPAFRSPAASTA